MHIAQTIVILKNLSLLELLLEDILEGDGVSSELADTLAELVDGHGVLVEVEAEEGSSLRYDFFSRSSLLDSEAMSFWGTSSLLLYSSSRRLGYKAC